MNLSELVSVHLNWFDFVWIGLILSVFIWFVLCLSERKRTTLIGLTLLYLKTLHFLSNRSPKPCNQHNPKQTCVFKNLKTQRENGFRIILLGCCKVRRVSKNSPLFYISSPEAHLLWSSTSEKYMSEIPTSIHRNTCQ